MMTLFDKEMIQLWKQLNEDERCKILQWVSDIKYEDDHRAASKGRVNVTGEWLLCHEAYLKWRQSAKSTLLWLNGIPGAGKTKLSTRVVDDLLALLHSQPHQGIGFANFYCDHNRADRNDPVAIIRSLVRQLCCPRGSTSIDTCVEDQYLSRKAKGFASGRLTAEECRDLLFRLLAGYQNVYIVVDGLDECDRASRHILMDLLEEMLEKFDQSIKVYIASRKATDLTKRYQKGDHLEVSANDNQADIERFVLDKMNQSEFCRTNLSPKLRDQILRTFHDKSQGMFQWATLHIGELLQLERQADIEEYLHELPQGLEAAYEKIFDQIARQRGSKRKIAFAAFQILMVSWRPLHPFELSIAVAQEPNRGFIIDHDVDIAYVLDACHNLLVVADGSLESVVSEESRMETTYDYHFLEYVDDRPFSIEAIWENDFGITQDSICKFSHLPVQEYLEAKHWSSSEAHAFMAAICLRTLLCLQLPGASWQQNRPPDGDEDDKEWDDPVILSVAETTKNRLMKVIQFDDMDNFPLLSVSLL
ncbi:hypothetical protein IL306_004140 [Fusarium sp. DS 682]|nr:hypothetical protein IL306_004140 [Fusarium sp. DS 682]